MAGEYERGISIREAIDMIDHGALLLPAIQRKFIWKPKQMCALFDSLMRQYPINTFMMWDVTEDHIKNSQKFYRFLPSFVERFKEDNEYLNTAGHENFKAVIDGQQRLNSIYIGLKGTYAFKQPRVWWPSTDDVRRLPRRHLYLDLNKRLESEGNDLLLAHNFRFLTDAQVQRYQEKGDGVWFRIGDILNKEKFPPNQTASQFNLKVATPYLNEIGLEGNQYALETLNRLYEVVHAEKTIHYYNETSQDINHVLDVFIRTNHGGTQLSFSDLLMSVAVSNWDGDAKRDIDQLVKQVTQDAEMGFSIGRDWVLKAALVLTNADVRFRVENFNPKQIELIQQNWEDIRDCVVASFKLIRGFGLTDQSLRAKNAVIPIAYYLFHKKINELPLYASINNLAYHAEERKAIGHWLHMAILKGVFSGQGDNILRKMRGVLMKLELYRGAFPVDGIIDAFKGTTKDLRFDIEFIEGLLDVEYSDPRCRSILALMFPEVNVNQILHVDHLHPKSAFRMENLKKQDFLQNNPELLEFYQDRMHWNTIPNLHLLNSAQNLSKHDHPLADWVADSTNGFRTEDLLLGADFDLSFTNFKLFYKQRKKALKKRLMSRLRISSRSLLAINGQLDESDEDDV